MAGVYWTGQDGKTYVRADGYNGGNVGVWNDQPGNQRQAEFFNGLKQIGDPNAKVILGEPYQGNGSQGSASSYDPNTEIARAQIDQGISQSQDALNRIDGQLNTALSNIGSQYNDAYNRLTASQAATNRDYGTNVTNQTNDYLTSRQGIQSNAAARIARARRILGMNGAGGSSADLYAIPNAVQQDAANDNATAQNTNARNLAALATAKSDNDRKYGDSFADLLRQRQTSENSTKSQFEQQRASILDTLAGLAGQKNILNGGNATSALAAAQPYTSRISGILNTIDSLAANPAVIKANAPTLSAATLADYINPRTNVTGQTGPVAQDTTLSPAIAALLGYDTQDQRQLL